MILNKSCQSQINSSKQQYYFTATMLFLSVDSKVAGPVQPRRTAQAAGLLSLSYFLAAIIYNPATFRELLKCLLPSREMEVL